MGHLDIPKIFHSDPSYEYGVVEVVEPRICIEIQSMTQKACKICVSWWRHNHIISRSNPMVLVPRYIQRAVRTLKDSIGAHKLRRPIGVDSSQQGVSIGGIVFGGIAHLFWYWTWGLVSWTCLSPMRGSSIFHKGTWNNWKHPQIKSWIRGVHCFNFPRRLSVLFLMLICW